MFFLITNIQQIILSHSDGSKLVLLPLYQSVCARPLYNVLYKKCVPSHNLK